MSELKQHVQKRLKGTNMQQGFTFRFNNQIRDILLVKIISISFIFRSFLNNNKKVISERPNFCRKYKLNFMSRISRILQAQSNIAARW